MRFLEERHIKSAEIEKQKYFKALNCYGTPFDAILDSLSTEDSQEPIVPLDSKSSLVMLTPTNKYNSTLQEIQKLYPESTNKFAKENIKIYPQSENEHLVIRTHFVQKKFELYVIKPKIKKTYQSCA
ncbi:hypothetical protein CDAR_282091 [Caerostris darwini]|uniref:Uncharacterized protein n=1 Tax=Caerostris darwini TaxID=1538125 RepID=A0AAV4WQE5_9ARAC|nr:hypothetical protein CDAR_282091 [Caerostris darwini]